MKPRKWLMNCWQKRFIWIHFINDAGIATGVGVAFSRICLRSKRTVAWAINTKLGTRILYSSRSACIDPEVKRSKVKIIIWLREPSQHTVASDHGSDSSYPYAAELLWLLPAWVCMSIRLPMFSSCILHFMFFVSCYWLCVIIAVWDVIVFSRNLSLKWKLWFTSRWIAAIDRLTGFVVSS